MQKFIFLLAIFAFTGCATDGAYEVGRVAYIGGKAVVEANADLLPEETLDKLDRVDEVATHYDSTRTIIKEAIDKNDRK